MEKLCAAEGLLPEEALYREGIASEYDPLSYNYLLGLRESRLVRYCLVSGELAFTAADWLAPVPLLRALQDAFGYT